MSFEFRELEIPGVFLVETTRHGDERGFFQESFKASAFLEAGLMEPFVQDNFARSARGVLRGLHFQRPPQAQGKLVEVTRGAVFDVGVDLRVGSPTYGRWTGIQLSEESGTMLYLPPGMGHGYCVLSDVAHVAYKVTAEFAPELDGGIRWDDPQLGVRWPITAPVLSQKDRSLPLLREVDPPFIFSADSGDRG